MDRRQFILGLGALAAAAPAHAALTCGPFVPGPMGAPVQGCDAGVPGNVADVVAAAVGGQHMNQWCWAASLETVLRYHGRPMRQERIVAENMGGIVNLPADPWTYVAALNRSYVDDNGVPFRISGDVYTANPVTAAQDLAAGLPLIIGTMGHAMVLTAVSYTRDMYGNGQIRQAMVRDPWPERGRRVLSAQEWFSTSFLARIRVS